MTSRRVALLSRAAVAVAATVAFASGSLAVALAPAAATPSKQEVRVITANVDFVLSPATVRSDIAQFAGRADVILIQEAKNVVLRNLVDTSIWNVKQDTSSSDRAGSAILVRRSQVTSVDDFHLVLGVNSSSCPGGGIETRWMAVATLNLNNGGRLVVAALHMPPARCQTGIGSSYDRMSDNVVQLSRDHPDRLVMGADWNKVVLSDPNNIVARCSGRLVVRAPQGSIDGFMIPANLNSDSAQSLASTHSDHRPVLVTLTVPATF